MNTTKKITLSSIGASLMLLPFTVLAYSAPGEPANNTGLNLSGLTGTIVDAIWGIFAALAIIMFIYAGILFLTAQGAPEKIAQARQAALWGVVGVVVIVLAFSIFAIATNLIGGTL